MVTLKEALDAYRQGDFKRNAPMAKFCGVAYRTAMEWGDKRKPGGEALNKLYYFLEAHGYKVFGDKTHPVVYLVGKLVAYDVLTVGQALELFGLSGKQSHVWTALQGKSVPLVARNGEISVETLTRLYGLSLEDAVAKRAEEGLVPAAKPGSSLRSSIPVQSSNDSYITVAAAFVSGLGPLLKRIDAEGDPAVQAFRSSLDADVFHDVLDLLKSMSSRKAREYYKGTGK